MHNIHQLNLNMKIMAKRTKKETVPCLVVENSVIEIEV